MFSRIVPAITLQNIGSLAPLTVISLVYGVVGAGMAWIIRCSFWVPHRFRYGILAAGGWGNYGDIRTCGPTPYLLQTGRTQQNLRSATAIAMGITASVPFNGVDDENLAIAYISMIMLVFLVRFLFSASRHLWPN
jgi:predicted permease